MPAETAPGRGALRLAGRIAAVLLAAGFVALLGYGLLTKAADTTIDEGLKRSRTVQAPGFVLPVLQRGEPGPGVPATLGRAFADGRLSLRELRGRPVVLNFWASWCDPCREETPILERAWQQARGTGVVFLGLNMQDITDDAREFIAELQMTYPNVRDRGNGIARDYGVTGLPETFFIAPNGRIVGHVIGAVSPDQLRGGIEAARASRPLGVESGGERRETR